MMETSATSSSPAAPGKLLTVAAALAAAIAASKNSQTVSRCRKYAEMQGYGDDGDFCEFVTRCITHEADFVDFSKAAAWQSHSARLNGLSAVAAVLETNCVRERLDSTYVDVKRKLVQLQQKFRVRKEKNKKAVVKPPLLAPSATSSEDCDEDDDDDDEVDSLQELEVIKTCASVVEVKKDFKDEDEEFQQRDYMRVIFQQSRRIRDLELQLLAALRK